MINVIINSDTRKSVNKLALQAAVVEVLQQHRVWGNIEINISIVGDKKMHEINKKFRGIDSTTNILSFALEDPTSISTLQHVPRMGFVKSPDNIIRLGDIMISHSQVVNDASQEGVTVDEELIFLVQHGTKHLLGIHHN